MRMVRMRPPPKEVALSGNKSVSALSQGQLFAGRYQLGEKIGEGGMGAVFAAIDCRLGSKPVVVKVLHEDFNLRTDLVERLMMEAQVAAEIDHENIVNVTDRGQDEVSGLYFVCYEKLKGCELLKLIEAGSLEPAVTVDILLQVCSAMVAAHKKGIIHRDLKPENIFIVPRRSGPHVKVLDFGIAKLTQDVGSEGSKNRRTQTGAILGTPPYMAYEQLMAQALDGRVDVHALGCILHEMVAGETPFEGDSPAAIAFAIRGGERKLLADTDLDSIVARATHWNRDERTPSVEIFSAQLEEYARKHCLLPQASRASAVPSASGVIGNENPTPVEAPVARGQTHVGPVVTDVGDERRRRPVRIVAAAVLVTLLAAIGIVVGVGGHTPPRRTHTASPPMSVPTTPVTPVPGPVAEPAPVTPPTPSVEPSPEPVVRPIPVVVEHRGRRDGRNPERSAHAPVVAPPVIQRHAPHCADERYRYRDGQCCRRRSSGALDCDGEIER